jgi:Uma2 family endonuclease
METKNKPYPDEETLDKKVKDLIAHEPPAVYGLGNPVRYTYADYLAWADDKRRELINGVVYDLFGAPTRLHAKISLNLSFLFKWFIKKRKGKCEIYYAPFDVRLPKYGEITDDRIYTVVQPDICVICDPEKLDEKGCLGAPDLIVEVQSPATAKRDLNEKFNLYEHAGVREYWVVFPKDQALTVFLLQEDGLFDQGTTYEYEGKVPVSIFDGLEIDLQELFED